MDVNNRSLRTKPNTRSDLAATLNDHERVMQKKITKCLLHETKVSHNYAGIDVNTADALHDGVPAQMDVQKA